MTYKAVSIFPVWLLVIVGAVLVGLLVPPADYFTWLPIVFAAGLLATFSLQLALPVKEGLVLRVMFSVAGSIAILAIASGVLALVA